MGLAALKHQECGCNQQQISAYVDTSNYDPTRTLSLRNAFAREMAKRFTGLRGVIRQAIVTQDVFGLTSSSNIVVQQEFSVPRKNAFAFPRSSDKVQAFMSWLRQQEQAGILEVREFQQVGAGVERAWTNKYIDSAYQRGVIKARSEMRKAGIDVPSIAETGGVAASMVQPIHADRVGLLYTRTFNDLAGITTAMDAQISRVLAQAMADGKGPREIARLLTRTISGPVGDLGITDTLGRFIPAERRARQLARTEVIRAHHKATIQEYRNWAVEGVIVQAEFVTAGDDRVCVECQALEGKVYTLDEAENLIPVHTNCRCNMLPKDVTRH
ncbi:MAG: phage minor head protein [Methylococcaceae bacterium]